MEPKTELKITKDDIIERVFFITKLVQNQKSTAMQGALTSKSDSMGGIFDRFINTISDSLVINDYYYYNPSKSVSGIAPDIFGITVNGKKIRFTKFNNKWKAEKGMPQIEIKTFKAKDQMISLRNQGYSQYMIFVDLNLRIDYLVPFLDKKILNNNLVEIMQMDDSIFIEKDKKSKIKKVTSIDYSSNDIGTMKLIAITSAKNFMRQATYCEKNVSVRRMKQIKVRKVNIRTGLLHEKLNEYATKSVRVKKLYEFNDKWRNKFNIGKNVAMLDFSADKLDKIEICKYNNDGIVITALEEGCSFNGQNLELGKQYTVTFATLDRTGNNGSEYFMQKQCAFYLNGVEDKLINELEKIIG